MYRVMLNMVRINVYCSSHRSCSVRKVFLEISQNSLKNTCARASFLIKLQSDACNYIKKEALALLLSCEFCEISKNTFSHRTPPVAASGIWLLESINRFLTIMYDLINNISAYQETILKFIVTRRNNIFSI